MVKMLFFCFGSVNAYETTILARLVAVFPKLNNFTIRRFYSPTI